MGADPSFVGKDAACYAPAHGREHGADDTAADAPGYGVNGEGEAQHFRDSRRERAIIGDDDNEGHREVENRHRGHDDARHLADAVNAAH